MCIRDRALTLVTVFSSCYAYIGGGALVANWFPKKKGLAMGYTTMGNNFASAFFVPMISHLGHDRRGHHGLCAGPVGHLHH